MKYALALAVVLATVVICNSSAIRVSPRANLNVGYIGAGDRLLHRSYVFRAPIANSVQYQDVVFFGNSTNRITAVQATEVGATQWASAWINGGSLGLNNVTVRFQSYRGNGYYYLLDIWGR